MPDSQRRSYTSARRANRDEPFIIEIDGEEFKAYPGRIPGAVLLDLPGMAVHMDSQPMWETFECALGEEYDRFRAFVRSPAHDVDAEMIAEILKDLAEAGSNLPTRPLTP